MLKIFKLASYVSSLILVSIYFLVYLSDKEKLILIPYINAKFNIYELRIIFFLIVVIMLVYFLVYIFFITQNKKLNNIEDIKVIESKQEKFNSLNFLFSNILPIVTLNFEEIANTILFVALLVILGYIFIRNDMFYINPLYDIFGLRIYEATVLIGKATHPRKTILISRKKIYDIDNIMVSGVVKNNIIFINSPKS